MTLHTLLQRFSALSQSKSPRKKVPPGRAAAFLRYTLKVLKRGLNLKIPRPPAAPPGCTSEFLLRRAHSPQTRRADILVRRQLVLLYHLLERLSPLELPAQSAPAYPNSDFPRRFAICLCPFSSSNSTYGLRRKIDGKPHFHSKPVNSENQDPSQLHKHSLTLTENLASNSMR